MSLLGPRPLPLFELAEIRGWQTPAFEHQTRTHLLEAGLWS
jgi:hypothetical protein